MSQPFHSTFILIAAVIVCALVSGASTQRANAQEFSDADVLRPASLPLQVGAAGGVLFAFSQGAFVTSCNCSYDGGKGAGPFASLSLEYPLSHRVRLTAQVQYNLYATSFAEREVRRDFVAGLDEALDVPFERRVDVDVAHMGVAAGVMVATGLGALDAIAMIGASVPVDDTFRETESITTPGLIYRSTGASSKTYINGAISDVYRRRDLRVTIEIGAGYDIPITRALHLQPHLMFAFPLTAVVEEYSAWKTSALRLGLAARIRV